MAGLSEWAGGSRAYGAGIAVAGLAAFITVWTTIVRDDGHGIGFFAVIMAAGVGGFSASFRAAGMARAMFGAAMMQVLVAIAIATAPLTATFPGGASKIVAFSAVYVVLWLISAACFAIAARHMTSHDRPAS